MTPLEMSLPTLGLSPSEGGTLPADVLSRLPQAERERALRFVSQIDPTDDAAMRMYGAAEQGTLSTFIDRSMPVLLKDASPGAPEAVEKLKAQLTRWDAYASRAGFSGLMWNLFPGFMLKRQQSAFGSVAPAIERAADALLDVRIQLLRVLATLERMEEENNARFDRLSAYVACGKLLKKQLTKAEAEPQVLQRLERRLYDLELSRQISLQMSAQIALIQSSCRLSAEQMQVTLDSTIPLWKAGAMLTLGLAQQQASDDLGRRAQQALGKSLNQGASTLTRALKQQKRDEMEKVNARLRASMDDLMRALQSMRAQQQQAHSPQPTRSKLEGDDAR